MRHYYLLIEHLEVAHKGNVSKADPLTNNKCSGEKMVIQDLKNFLDLILSPLSVLGNVQKKHYIWIRNMNIYIYHSSKIGMLLREKVIFLIKNQRAKGQLPSHHSSTSNLAGFKDK